MSDIADQLQKLGLALPQVAAPAGAYVPAVEQGGTLYVSGQLPMQDGNIIYQGKVGSDISVEDGQAAAQLCGLNILAQASHYCTTHNKRIDGVIKLGGFVQCNPDFTDQPKIINGASELMTAVLGDSGQHARFAVGANALPLNAAVEVEAIIAIS